MHRKERDRERVRDREREREREREYSFHGIQYATVRNTNDQTNNYCPRLHGCQIHTQTLLDFLFVFCLIWSAVCFILVAVQGGLLKGNI
jgi:hypothetical protein